MPNLYIVKDKRLKIESTVSWLIDEINLQIAESKIMRSKASEARDSKMENFWKGKVQALTDFKIYQLDQAKERHKQEIIGTQLQLLMKDHNLPYGLTFVNLLSEKTEEAENYYKEYYAL